jgi:hypothetical protein
MPFFMELAHQLFPAFELHRGQSNRLHYNAGVRFERSVCCDSLMQLVSSIRRYRFIYECDGSKFLLNIAVNLAGQFFFVWLSYVGREEDACGYRYSVQFKGRDLSVIKQVLNKFRYTLAANKLDSTGHLLFTFLVGDHLDTANTLFYVLIGRLTVRF